MPFSETLWKDVLNYYYKNSRNPIIIDEKVTLLFASWVDQKNPPYRSLHQLKYEFKLLYRSSKDGLNSTAFHRKCDGIIKTLVVAKIQNSDQLVGGYNPLRWDGSRGVTSGK